MDPIEKMLRDEREKRNNMTAPASMEKSLTEALQYTAPQKKPRKKTVMKIVVLVAAILLFSLTSYNYPALAYYSKKMIGFEGVPNLTLAVLNEQEKGQVIDKSVTLSDGTVFTIDGIMTDENQFILFYTLANSNGVKMEFPFMHVSGFLSNARKSHGTGKSNDDGTVFKGIAHFTPINLFAKNLTLKIGYEGIEENEISFKHDPNKAMATNFKQKINQSFTVDQGKLTFSTITATPTSTIITGKSTVKNLDKLNSTFDRVKLIANGEEVIQSGFGYHTEITGTEFDITYNALREDTETLSVMIQDFVGYDVIDKTISLEKVSDSPITLIKEKELLIKEINQIDNHVEITIATDENVLLDGVTIEAKNGETSLKTTIGEDYVDNKDGEMMKERTLVFESNELPYTMNVKGIHHLKPYYQSFDIPVKK